jgi:hypothetical protein
MQLGSNSLKGWEDKAQGIALGWEKKDCLALKGREEKISSASESTLRLRSGQASKMEGMNELLVKNSYALSPARLAC